jgi:hypothetical protein
MSASYRTYLNQGHMPEWEEPLRQAVKLIRKVTAEISPYDEDQYDNAADTGVLRYKLFLALELIEAELPRREDNEN